MTPFRVVILFILAALISLSVLPDLKVSWAPQGKTTSLTINYNVLQADPVLTEQQATAALENALSQIKGLKDIHSVSRYNGGSITLDFDNSSDMAMKRFMVAMYIRHLYPQLPEGISYPVISGGAARDQNQHVLLIYSVNGPAQPFQVKKEAEEVLQKKLMVIPGISRIDISGTPGLEVHISFNPSLLQRYGLLPADITQAINQRYNISYPGVIRQPDGTELFLRIRDPSGGASIAALNRLFIKTKKGIPIRLKDVATVFLTQAEPVSYFRINGNNSVNLSIYPHQGVNSMVLAARIKKQIDTASSLLPGGYEVSLAYDDTDYLVKELDKTRTRMALSAAILLLFILLSYRSWRYLLTLFTGLLVNLALTVLGVWLFGVPIHLYTLAGIAISFGLMTDNAIVMIDYFHQYRNRRVFLALLGATLTTVAALMLVFFLPADERKNLTDFVVIVTIALTTSLMTALWFIPGLYHLVFKEKAYYKRPHTIRSLKKRVHWQNRYTIVIAFLYRFRAAFYLLIILLFGLPVFLLPGEWKGAHWYNHWYNETIGSDKYQSDIKPVVDKWLGGTLFQFVNKVYDRSSFRDIQQTRLYVSASLSYGHTPQQMNNLLRDMERYLKEQPGIDQFITHVYSGQYGMIQITFKPQYEKGAFPFTLKSRLIAQSLNQSGADWNIYGVGRGFSNAGGTEIPSFRVIMKGYNYEELARQADRLSTILQQHPRIRDVNTNAQLSYSEKPGKVFVLAFNRRAMALNQVSSQEIVHHLHTLGKAVYPSTNISINH
ncbi:MAG TPA: efflux RND transporter permease subunit, partial [Fodinibius sp.]|nr:efflux RND transporter permease subunit [Fodinibius sp.]